MKKLLLFAAACLILTGCGDGSESSDSESSQTASDLVSIADASSTDSSAEVSSDVGTPVSTASSSKASVSKATSSVKTSSIPTKVSSAIASSKAAVSSAASAASSLPSNVIKITIPEGYSLSQIGAKLEDNGICTKAAFLSTVNSYDFTYYDLVSAIPTNANRCYKLEGYLFPNTYELYKNTKPQDIIGKMLRSAETNIGDKYSYDGMSTNEIITLASIIEKEANSSAEMAKISSVYHNRLKAGMKLQSDPTINYIEWYVKPNLATDIDRFNSFYNTYKCAALPAGPICSPGAAALKAACNPADTEYLYFAADSQGNYYYAKTFAEHVNNCRAHGIVTSETTASSTASVQSSN